MRMRRDPIGYGAADIPLGDGGSLLVGFEDMAPETKPWRRSVPGGPVGLFAPTDQVVFGDVAEAIPHSRDKVFIYDEFPAAGNVGVALRSSTGKAYIRLRGESDSLTQRGFIVAEDDEIKFGYGTVDDPDSMTLAGKIDESGDLIYGSKAGNDMGFTYLAGQPFRGIRVTNADSAAAREIVVAGNENNASKGGVAVYAGNGANRYSALRYATSGSVFDNFLSGSTVLATTGKEVQYGVSSGNIRYGNWSAVQFDDMDLVHIDEIELDNNGSFGTFSRTSSARLAWWNSEQYVKVKRQSDSDIGRVVLFDDAAPTAGDLLYFNTGGKWARLADIATGNVLLSGGVGAAPSYGKVDLTASITGVLPIANGGTNASSFGTSGGARGPN